MSLISVCFAVYQNEGSLTILYNDIVHHMDSNFPNHDFEFIFVNDGSKDNSLNELIELKKKKGDTRIKIISFSRNFGQVPAIIAGWKYSKGDAVINMAADLQDPPSQCVEMIKEWEAGNEVVVCYRKAHQTSSLKKITSYISYKILLPNIPPGGFDFVLLDRKAVNVMNSFKERNRFYQFDVLSIGFRLKFIPYEKLERTIGKSQWKFIKRFNYFMVGFINVNYLLLRLMTFLGVSFFISGFLYALVIVYEYFYNNTPFNGWAPIMILLLIIGGLIMLMLGILGQYIWRIFDEVKQRPLYIVDREI